jgi:hypothetical protein
MFPTPAPEYRDWATASGGLVAMTNKAHQKAALILI